MFFVLFRILKFLRVISALFFSYQVEVNGENAAALFKFLKSGKWGFFGDEIQWNFVKFLIDKNGVIVDRYYPTTSPLTIEVDNTYIFDLYLVPHQFCRIKRFVTH